MIDAAALSRLPDPEGVERDRNDRRLLDGVRAGEVGGLQGLIDAYWRPLLGYATRLLDDTDAAEDLVQEAFIRIWERRADLRPNGSGRVLLYTVVRNLGLNRRKSDRTRVRPDIVRRIPRPQPPTTPADLLQAAELGAAVAAAIQALPARRREVLQLARFDDLSRQEIADLLGLSPQTVANHLAMALAALKERLRPHLD